MDVITTGLYTMEKRDAILVCGGEDGIGAAPLSSEFHPEAVSGMSVSFDSYLKRRSDLDKGINEAASQATRGCREY